MEFQDSQILICCKCRIRPWCLLYQLHAWHKFIKQVATPTLRSHLRLLSWLEECVQSFLRLISARCYCDLGRRIWQKKWMFTSSWQPISALGCLCFHPSGSHTSLVGARLETGEYLSRQTACYPEALAIKFATLVTPLLQQISHDWKWDDIKFIPRKKDLLQPPFGHEEGGGLPSNPDWTFWLHFDKIWKHSYVMQVFCLTGQFVHINLSVWQLWAV